MEMRGKLREIALRLIHVWLNQISDPAVSTSIHSGKNLLFNTTDSISVKQAMDYCVQVTEDALQDYGGKNLFAIC